MVHRIFGKIMNKDFEHVDLVTERTVHFCDHEVLLSFNNDSGAHAFHEWWGLRGNQLFQKYCQEEFEDE